MKVWAHCEACRLDHTYVGGWVDEEEVEHIDPLWAHQLREYEVVISGDHEKPLVGWTLSDFGIPEAMESEDLTLTAMLMDGLTEHGYEYPAWAMAAWFVDKRPLDLTPGEFKALYAGTWAGKPTRAARRRFTFTRAGEGHWYMWRA